jgi:hypothetical protein
MSKVNFVAERRDLYAPSAKDFSSVVVPAFQFLMVDGRGDPNTSPDWSAALQALYALSYGAKFACKAHLDADYVVLPLEGLWWAETPEAFIAREKDSWSWTVMIRQPVELTAELWATVREKAAKKQLPALARVRLETFDEALSVQIMHVGSYDAEAPTIARMHDWIAANGYVERGVHHELYLGDPRRTAPERLRTILRQPISPR